MKITLIVSDNKVYVGGRVATVDLSSLANTYRAVQWQEHSDNVGHLELLDGVNEPLDATGFSSFDVFVNAAQAVFDAEDEAARLLAESEAALNVVVTEASAP